jgi:ribonuclease E
MEESRNRRDVENRLRDALRHTAPACTWHDQQVWPDGNESQRLRPALSEGIDSCPSCVAVSGHIRDTESSALQILRPGRVVERQHGFVWCQPGTGRCSVFPANEKTPEISKIEMKQRASTCCWCRTRRWKTPNYKLERLKHRRPAPDNIEAQLQMADEADDRRTRDRAAARKAQQVVELIIKGVSVSMHQPLMPVPQAGGIAPVAAKALPAMLVHVPVAAIAEKGLFDKNLFGMAETPEPAPAPVLREESLRRKKVHRAKAGLAKHAAEQRPERGGRAERGGRSDSQ